MHIGLLYFVTEMKLFMKLISVEHIPKEIKQFVDRPSSSALQNKNIKANIFWVQANNSVMCGYFCIGFIDFVLADKKLTDYNSLFSPHDLRKNYDLILFYFRNE